MFVQRIVVLNSVLQLSFETTNENMIRSDQCGLGMRSNIIMVNREFIQSRGMRKSVGNKHP